jgi:5-formyltetrahydrofolate cyclo-ligase
MSLASPIVQRKAALRETAIAHRNALDPGARAQAARRIAASELPFTMRHGVIVSGWHAMGSELDPLPLLLRLAGEGASLALPVIAKGRLLFRAWQPGEPLVGAGFGTSEPRPDAAETDPDIVLVPLLAFDRLGFRLGYGKGHYDGGLARLRAKKPIVAAGLAFAAQETAEVPTEPHDQRLDFVITESGVRFAAGAGE